MTPLEIQFELKKKEVLQKEIARELNVSDDGFPCDQKATRL